MLEVRALVGQVRTAGAAASRVAGAGLARVRRAVVGAMSALRIGGLRERVIATGVFAGLALIAAAGLDYIISGGPDWNPNAEAAPYVSAAVTLTALPDLPYAAPLPAPAPATLDTEAAAPLVYAMAAEELLGGPDGLDDASTQPAAFEFAPTKFGLPPSGSYKPKP